MQVFPCLTAINNQQMNNISTELTFSTTKKIQNNFDSSTYVFELPPPAPTATHILAHPAAKYLFIRVCPKFAISHFAGHHVVLKKASVNTRSYKSQNDHSIPLQLRAGHHWIAKDSGHTRIIRYVRSITAYY